MDFADKVIVVTGAGSGIGEAIACEFAAAGGKVTLVDIDSNNGERVTSAIRAAGRRAMFAKADVSDEEQVARAVSAVVDAWGRVDVLINNAGIDFKKSFKHTTSAEWDRVMNINLKSVFLMSKLCAPYLERSREGSIVNIASVHALATIPNADAYAAAKGGVASLTRSMALSLQEDGIRVNAVCPGYVPTPMWENPGVSDEDIEQAKRDAVKFHPVGRLGTPYDVARLCVFLSSPDAGFINGQVIAADGGVTVQLMH